MALDDENELPIYRVISLWLENKDNDDINMIVDQELKKKSSHKFIMVLPQLVAHLSLTYDHEFHKSLESFISIKFISIVNYSRIAKIFIFFEL